MFHPCGTQRDEAVELLERVDGALGRDDPLDDVDEERRPRNAPALEDGGLLVLVHGPHGHSLALKRSHARCNGATEAAVGAEEGDELLPDSVETVELRSHVAEGRALLGKLEGDAGPEAHRQHTHLAVQREHERRQSENGETEDHERREHDRVAGRAADLDVRECAERGGSREENGPSEEKVGASLLGAEAPAP